MARKGRPPIEIKEGERFNHFTFIRFDHTRKGSRGVIRKALCLCSCGTEKLLDPNQLTNGTVKSCGCVHNKKHNMSSTKEYRCWVGIRSRCLNERSRLYKYYGGRGIKVCDRWLESFENFYEDMGDKPSDKHSIDRIDVDGDYCPSNCRWTTQQEQMDNRRPILVKNKTGYTGVSKTRAGNFSTSFRLRGKSYHVGTFKSAEEASKAREEAIKQQRRNLT